MRDTTYFQEALQETNRLADKVRLFTDLPVDTQSYVLRRAQEIKTAYEANRKERAQ
jgi:hypothetical protein